MFRYFKQRRELKDQAKALYNKAVTHGRMPVFYEDFDVPDTIDGRFEMIALHNFMIMYSLREAKKDKLSQFLFDSFFVNMDRSLREIGIGDLGVPKHMKRMMQGFNGRCESYASALKKDDVELLKQALERNVYGTVEKPSDEVLSRMVHYIKQSISADASEGYFAMVEVLGGVKRHG